MGGAEINLMKADMQKPINLEVNNVFGGTKLIVPSNWDVKMKLLQCLVVLKIKEIFRITFRPG